VTSVEDFREIVSGRQKELSDLNAVMKKKSAEIKELKDMIRYGEWYKQAQPILREICSTKNAKKKEQIKSQNDETMRKYYVAKRIQNNSLSNLLPDFVSGGQRQKGKIWIK